MIQQHLQNPRMVRPEVLRDYQMMIEDLETGKDRHFRKTVLPVIYTMISRSEIGQAMQEWM